MIIYRGNYEFKWEAVGDAVRPGLYRRETGTEDFVTVLESSLSTADGSIQVLREDASISPDGNHVVYAKTIQGSAFKDVYIHDIEQGHDIDGVVKGTAGINIAWHPNKRGFYYNLMRNLRDFPPPQVEDNLRDGVYWHVFGTPHAQDALVQAFQGTAAADSPLPIVTDDGRYLLLNHHLFGAGMDGFHVRPLSAGTEFKTLIPDGLGEARFLGNRGQKFYFETTIDAPNGRIVAIQPDQTSNRDWEVVVPESEDILAKQAIMSDEKIFAVYTSDVKHSVKVFDSDGREIRTLAFPNPVTVAGLQKEPRERFISIHAGSFLIPLATYHYKMKEQTLERVWSSSVPDDISDFEVNQVFYPSKDGTSIPMFLIHRKGLEPNGRMAVYMFGYGGWGQAITPNYLIGILTWLRIGGMVAVPGLRGGGEYGEAWHRAGMRENKQTTFDDFIAAATYLIDQGYTTPEGIGVSGLSAGGLLTATVFNQRPDLFGAVISQVPLTNPLAGDIPELGTPSSDPDAFQYIRAYSPLQNVTPADRKPALLTIVAELDGIAAQGYAFVAEVQHHARPGQVAILRIVRGAGHSSWSDEDGVDSMAEQFTFLVRNLDADFAW